jgi:hypothetical protein
MQKWINGGLLVILGVVLGAGLVYGTYKDSGYYCKCIKSGGGTNWVNAWIGTCPDDVKNALKEIYGGTCP